MSREQWGHGYQAGLKAQKKNKSHRFITTHGDDGSLWNAGIVIEERGDGTLTIEGLDWLECEVVVFTGSEIDHESPTVIGNVQDCALSELKNPKFHATWATVANEFIKAAKEHNRRRQIERGEE